MGERRLLAVAFAILLLVSAAALIAMLSGCAANETGVAMPTEVKLPVATAPPPCIGQLPAHPALPIAALGDDSPPADTVRAYAATVAILKGAVAERDALLGGCVAPQAPKPQAGRDPVAARAAIEGGAEDRAALRSLIRGAQRALPSPSPGEGPSGTGLCASRARCAQARLFPGSAEGLSTSAAARRCLSLSGRGRADGAAGAERMRGEARVRVLIPPPAWTPASRAHVPQTIGKPCGQCAAHRTSASRSCPAAATRNAPCPLPAGEMDLQRMQGEARERDLAGRSLA
jgi:hypothetical protein